MSAMSMRIPQIHVFFPLSVLAISANLEMSTPAPIITATTKPKTNATMALPFLNMGQLQCSAAIHIALRPDKSGFKTGARGLGVSGFYRHIAPLERKT